MRLLSILAFSTGTLAQYNLCTDTARCDYQCSRPILGARESCTGNSADLACCTETEACDLVNAATLACTDLPYLDNAGAARTYSCCGGSDNSSDTDNDAGGDTDTDTDGDNSDTGGNSTEATNVTTEMDDSDSSASQIGISVLALVLAKLF